MKQTYALINLNNVKNLISFIVTFSLKDWLGNRLDRKKTPKKSKLKNVKVAKLYKSFLLYLSHLLSLITVNKYDLLTF